MKIVESGLIAHGRGEVVNPPKAHLLLDHVYNGHFNILPGYVAPTGMAGIKVVGDYVDNYRHGLPSELALLTLYDPRTGVPRAILDATEITWWRTGAVPAVGARHLASANSRVVAHIGARGTAFSNLELLAAQYPLDEIRIASKRRESREALAQKVQAATGVTTRAVDSIETAVRGADLVIEATRLEKPEVLIRAEWLKRGATVVTYGWVMALDPAIALDADALVVDDWEQCKKGGQLHPLIADGRLTADGVHAEIGEIAAGLKPGRRRDDERIVFWHRGFAVSDVVLGSAIYQAAVERGAGQELAMGEFVAE